MAHVAGSITTAAPSIRFVRPSLLLAAAGLSVGALLFALAFPAMEGRVYVADDLSAFHLPARAFYSDALAHGQRFDWWPQIFGGFYLTGEGQVGSYHPLHLALYRFLPLAVAFNLEVLLSYPWMLLGGYFWLRRRLQRSDVALFGAALMSFCSFNLLHLPHLNGMAVVAHIPWLLWAIDIVVCDSRPNRRGLAAAAVSLLTASQLLLGYPQYVWYSLLLEFGYTCWLLWGQRRAISAQSAAREGAGSGDLFRAIGRTGAAGQAPAASPPHEVRTCLALAAALLVGGLIGAIQVLPTFDALSHSVRHDAGRALTEWGSMHPWNLLQLVGPYLFLTRVVGLNTHELGLYAGCVPLVLCVWLWIRRAELGSLRPLVIAAAWLAVLALWVAAGQYGYLTRVLAWLPVVGKFRFPCRAIVLFQLAMAVLAAAAVTVLASRQPSRLRFRFRQFAPLWALVAFACLAAAGASLIWPRYVAAWPWVLVGPMLIALAAWLVWLADGYSRWALAGLMLLAAVDLGAYGLSYSVYGKTAEVSELAGNSPLPPTTDDPRMLDELPAQNSQSAHAGDRALLSGWSSVGGYAGLEPARKLDYRQLSALRVAGVGWVFRSAETAGLVGLIPYSATLLRVPETLPPQRLVTEVRASRDPARGLATIDVATTALVEPEFVEHVVLPPGTPGTVEMIDDAPGRCTVRTRAETPQLLVFNQSWHSGWRATVGGRRATVWRVNGDYVGCVVPAGESRVTIEFRPASLRYGERLSALGLGLWFVGLVCGWGFGWPRVTRDSTKELGTGRTARKPHE